MTGLTPPPQVFFVEAAGAEWFRADGWLKGHDPGRWFGLRTDAHLGMLARIELPSNNLTGEVSGLPCCLLPAACCLYCIPTYYSTIAPPHG